MIDPNTPYKSWLQRWKPLMDAHVASTPVLELGCGKGHDTATLTSFGYRVMAIDVWADALAAARRRCPGAIYHQQDMRDPLPAARHSIGVVVAGLSLHYFSWPDTLALLDAIRSRLHPGGVLLCRLNSVNDHGFGASGFPEIEPHLYRVGGRSKRFFDHADIARLFASDWRMISAEEHTIDWSDQRKSAWEVVAEVAVH